MNYQQNDLFRLAKRYQNAKRNYLLVNPLQAKHLAVEPEKSLAMMETLGRQAVQKYPDAKLIIGFAETATAIASACAMQFPEDVCFLNTTRETLSGECLHFSEEHSHAVRQKLYLSGNLPETRQILLIDDEISTGKTVRNIVSQIRQALPAYQDAELIAVSVINRVSDENLKLMEQDNIFCECLCKLENLDYTVQAEQFSVSAPEDVSFSEALPYRYIISRSPLPESRKPHTVREYRESYQQFIASVSEEIRSFCDRNQKILVLGTEECMYPALLLGQYLEQNGCSVTCHATTRSPIGISTEKDYPIRKGFSLPSFYDPSRKTYLYNTDASAGLVLIVTDSHADTAQAMQNLSVLFPDSEKILIKG